MIIKAGNRRLPVWPEPPSTRAADLPQFCPAEYRATIKNKYIIHLHQHPEIPFDDQDGTYLTADEIHEGAVSDMYHYCVKHDLSQVWAYMWNCWYCPKQWPLWARAASPEIPRLKSTMISESMWKVIKHNDLAMFNRPRLDLVTHVIIDSLVPRLRVKLANLSNTRRQGRNPTLAEWQKDFRHDWNQLSKPDELRNIERELEWLYKPKKTKGRAERLAQIRENAQRQPGTHHTNPDKWVCSCRAFLVSRFLLCKHLVRIANERMGYKPHTHIDWFANLRRNHSPPFYLIPGIHISIPSANNTLGDTYSQGPRVVLRTLDDTATGSTANGDGSVSGLTDETAREGGSAAGDHEEWDEQSVSTGDHGERGNNNAVDENQPTDDEGTEDDVSDRYVLTESDDLPNEHTVSISNLLPRCLTHELIVSRNFSHPPILYNLSEISTQ